MSKFKFKKKFGQNFLESDFHSDQIVDSINPNERDLILEIGPGAGAITKKLKKYNCKLIAFEIDNETKKFLLPLEDQKTKIIYEDFLEADVKNIVRDFKYERLFIIGNLPYYITTPILERIIDLELDPESITIMVQKEVADRFLAKPKNRSYGYMTVILNYHFNLEKITDVDRKHFYPIPNVDSSVIKLMRKEKKQINYDNFKAIVKEAFQFKRKTISNNFRNRDLNIIKTILEKHNFSLSSRAEELDLDTFIDISESNI